MNKLFPGSATNVKGKSIPIQSIIAGDKARVIIVTNPRITVSG